MGRGPSGSRPVLDLFVEQWPLLIFVPAVLILIAVLAGVTRWWDRRVAERAAETTTRGGRPAPWRGGRGDRGAVGQINSAASRHRNGPRGPLPLAAGGREPKPPLVAA